MTITGVSNSYNYVDNTQSRANAAASSPGAASISLSTATIDFAIRGESGTDQGANAEGLFSILNSDILYDPNLGGVGSAIDTYTSSLAGSNVYDSPYTTPTAGYLADLASLKTAAASGNLTESESLLATVKLAAPNSVAGGISTAIAEGDTAGEAALIVEGTANISDFLAANGYSPTGAEAEADAITINGLSLRATDTPTSSEQTRLQQISSLGVYAADNQVTNQAGNPATSGNPLLNIISTLIEAKSGTAIDQSLTNLATLYGVGQSTSTSNNA
jgi:hypothetical protein